MMACETISKNIGPGQVFYPDLSVSTPANKAELCGLIDEICPFFKKKAFAEELVARDFSPILGTDPSSLIWHIEFKNETTVVGDFLKRIDLIMTLERVSGMLNELSPEQLKIFDESVKRRHTFR